MTKPTPGARADVTRGCRVVPVLRTAGGVWISANAKKKTFEYGLVFEASDLLVVEEGAAPSAFNVEVASSDEEADGDDGASVGKSNSMNWVAPSREAQGHARRRWRAGKCLRAFRLPALERPPAGQPESISRSK